MTSRIWSYFSLLALGLVLGACKSSSAASSGAAAGQELFDSACAKCHGRDGRGGVPAREGLPPPRNFCDAAFQASRSDAQLKRVIESGKGPMPPFGRMFDAAELDQLVAYVRGFNPKK